MAFMRAGALRKGIETADLGIITRVKHTNCPGFDLIVFGEDGNKRRRYRSDEIVEVITDHADVTLVCL